MKPTPIRRMCRRQALVAFAVVLSGAHAAVAGESPPPLPAAVPASEIVGRIGSEPVTAGNVIDQSMETFRKDQADYELGLRQMELHHRESQHELLQKGLDALLDGRALALEAQARGTTEAAVLADLKVPEVTEAEVRGVYESRRSLTTQPFEELRPRIEQYLENEHSTAANRAFYDALRAKHQIVATLPPLRLPVEARGPVRGGPATAVTIVEFGDFQCPFCRAVEPTLHALLTKYPEDVRLVFRNMPLENVHPNAMVAARAGVCADRQGKFWQMHDEMFSHQDELNEPQLEQMAKHEGLKLRAFDACLGDQRTIEVVNQDAAIATELGINSTPYFFINGRPLHGNVPAEQFESIIAAELQRSRTANSQAAR